MSFPVRAESAPVAAAPAPRRSSATIELQTITSELDEGMRAEQANLWREVLLWQRWIRYLAIATMVFLAVAFGAVEPRALVPLTVLVAAYVAVVMGTAWMLLRRPDRPPGAWFPALLLTTDIAAVAGLSYLTSPPQEMHRILLIGFLSMQLGAFYFGRRNGSLAAVLTIIAYLTTALAAPPFVEGPRPQLSIVALNLTLFTIVSTVLIY
ncbi:MAG TPA: hypothetical protein VIP11_03955, partial [Gemmatimonadaceae bacterium]